ncbi:hypothetical protein K503DRAFT_857553 [Rhizopogon vinicolor AM-OR11-026]|uniref:NACHT domain-containing protein n=1 Tax=Rhizopogon vinicolor AM-OR11-026 TaxID=1314800 RepID=A0A1B7MWY0_9AGAM|nr:hypothetical protein K503DRAFT_857553 [Rhizopogon vinicolor AM-OR11-026]
MSHWDEFPRGTWEKLSQVAVKGAVHDSRERQPHPKCLEGTRVTLLNNIYELLDDREKSRIIWLNGTAGVGKSAVAFTVAERMRGLKVGETSDSKRLAGSFFFSREHTKRCTTAYFFATFVYQLARNFPSVREDVNTAIREDPELLDPDKSLREQMEALFLQPLCKLRFRLPRHKSPPLSFVVDALDECTETELADLVSLLGEALHNPDLPVIHILLTSRSKAHICEAIREEALRPLVYEIPVNTSGKGVAPIISLDGADVDSDIYIFLQHSFRKLRAQHSNFPQPTSHELERLASRAGRRFIVASTMMEFIGANNGYDNPRDRLQLMLDLTSELLPGTEVYKLYDRILGTCTDPTRAYMHLSIVAALANPLPMSQISTLLGPSQGWDIGIAQQLRSVMHIPTDASLPVNIYHSSVRDYVSDRSNCCLPGVQSLTPPHSLVAYSSLHLMMQDIIESTALLDALIELKGQSQVMQSDDHQSLKHSLSFIVEPPEPLRILMCLLWLRGFRDPSLRSWLDDGDGRAWLQTQGGENWLRTQAGEEWLQTKEGDDWLQSSGGKTWLQTDGGRRWLQSGRGWLWTQRWRNVTGDSGHAGERGLETQSRQDRLGTSNGGVELSQGSPRVWLQTESGRVWLQTEEGRVWLQQTLRGRDWLQTQSGREWLQTGSGQGWLQTQGGREWSLTLSVSDTPLRQDWLRTSDKQNWLDSLHGRNWLECQTGQDWLQTQTGRDWLQTKKGPGRWLRTWRGQDWLQTQSGLQWLQTQNAQEWLQTQDGIEWLHTPAGLEWLRTSSGLQTPSGREWLQTSSGQDWLQDQHGQDWLQTQSGREWLQTQSGRAWLQTPRGQAWQLTPAASVWVTMEEFSSTLEAIGEHTIIPELPLLPAFEVIQQFKSLPDFLIFPAFLALRHIDYSSSALSQGRFLPDMGIIHAMTAFVTFANEARERSQSASDALKYACQNWVFHLSRAPSPWDDMLNRAFKVFWNRHLLFWLEMQWNLKGLRPCLDILCEGLKLAKGQLGYQSGASVTAMQNGIYPNLVGEVLNHSQRRLIGNVWSA